MIGQHVPFLKCRPVVVRRHGVSQCGQVGEVDHIRRVVVTRRGRSLRVVTRERLCSSARGRADAVVRMQIPFFVCDALPRAVPQTRYPASSRCHPS